MVIDSWFELFPASAGILLSLSVKHIKNIKHVINTVDFLDLTFLMVL